ncbi:MAG: hypothetical protein LUO86_00060 [Methanomicrobiales archaeon]|jgi:hypothetical protein|nr:hypothetical protein [Methanomicrobiales archaeon]
MDEAKIEKAFREMDIGKEIRCPQAFAIAGRYHIPLADIGEYCNHHHIKIKGCQLGCFS